MCGIAGILHRSGYAGDCVSLVGSMLSRIQYRGPDESGIYGHRQVTLGSVRLSIIDLASGQQPLSSGDGRYRIVYNGEVFNYIELRDELKRQGVRFRTDSDTEVLLNAYIAYGPACLNRLNGQFAFAIWDHETQTLFLARDRTGIRPLFFTHASGCFIFGSEIKTLFEFPGVTRELDPLSLSQVFTLWTTITPRTVFRDIHELSPGHYMVLTPEGEHISPYWELRFPTDPSALFSGTVDEAAEAMDHLLTDAVRIRLRADVPVAAYLSGGLDSSATTSLIRKVAPESLNTFSIGFEDAEFDETSYQQEVSRFLDTRHTAFTCTRDDIAGFFPQVIWHTEIPVLRTAPVPMFCLSKQVRNQGIKVVITGEGADEILAGYDIFKEGIIRTFWARQPDSKLRPLLFNRLYPYLAQFQGKNKSLLRFFYGYKLGETNNPFYSHLLRWHNTSSLHNLLRDDVKAAAGNDWMDELHRRLPKDFDRYGQLARSQWLENFLFLSGYLLSSQGDRVGMANSVEGRYPFLDYRVVEFAATLPPDYKMHGLNEKYVLKRMMQHRLPDSVLKRPKQAYRAPIAQAFLSPGSRTWVNDLLGESRIRETGIFNPAAVTKLMDKVQTAPLVTEFDNMALSAILSTQLLIRQFIYNDTAWKPGLTRLSDTVIYKETNPRYI